MAESSWPPSEGSAAYDVHIFNEMNSSLTTRATIVAENTTHRNGTQSFVRPKEDTIMISIALCISAIAILQQLVAIAAIRVIRGSLRPLHKFILNMTLAELLFLISYMVDLALYISWEKYVVHCSGSIVPSLCQFFVSVANTSILCMVVDQYIAICNPLRYRAIVNGRFVAVSLFVTYLLSTVTTVVFFLSMESQRKSRNFEICLVNTDHAWLSVFGAHTISGHFHIIVFFSVIATITCLYARIGYTSCKMYRECKALIDTRSNRALKGRIKTAITVFCLFITWVPYWIICVVLNTQSTQDASWRVVSHVWTILIVLNVMCDPLIYGLRLQEVRNAYRTLYRIVMKSQERISTKSQHPLETCSSLMH